MTRELLRGQGIDPTAFDRGMFTQFQTWLGETKGTEGCPVNCRYCFFKLDGLTPMRPQQITPPEVILERLRTAPTYQESIPVHFGSQTDAFSTTENIDYYSKLISLYGESEYTNPLIFITKRRIPDSFIELSKEIPQAVVFFVSYSGLAGTGFEPSVVEAHQRDNFVRLYEHDAPVVHYWRPFTPLNSSDEKMREMLTHVSQYATCSVVNGLRLNSGIRDQVGELWPALLKTDFNFSSLGEVWPKGVRQSIQRMVGEEFSSYPVFFGNTPCAVSRSLQQPDRAGLLGGRMCRESNCDQRVLCEVHHTVPSAAEVTASCAKMGIVPDQITIDADMVVLAGKIDTQILVYLRNKLRFPVISSGAIDYVSGHNWANVTDDVKITEVDW